MDCTCVYYLCVCVVHVRSVDITCVHLCNDRVRITVLYMYISSSQILKVGCLYYVRRGLRFSTELFNCQHNLRVINASAVLYIAGYYKDTFLP